MVSARRLTTSAGRAQAGRFLAEGVQAVREALAYGVVHELFVTSQAQSRHAVLAEQAVKHGARVSIVTERAAGMLSETVSPQGVVAVCDTVDVSVTTALAGCPRLVAVLCGVGDPGNAGTVLRVADAAGADAVLLIGQTVDVHNGKCVRASTGSVFHLPIARCRDVSAALDACKRAGLTVLAADGHAEHDLQQVADESPTAWLLGSEAHGLPEEAFASVDQAVRVPIYGKAESLNLATAAAVCLYASAVAARDPAGWSPVEGDRSSDSSIN